MYQTRLGQNMNRTPGGITNVDRKVIVLRINATFLGPMGCYVSTQEFQGVTSSRTWE